MYVYNGVGIGSGQPLRHGGAFVIDSSFSGKLSQLNVWILFIFATADVAAKLKSQSCLINEFGNVIKWSYLEDTYGSMVVKERPIEFV